MRFLLCLFLISCAAGQHCPPNSALVAAECKQEVLKGTKTKEQCYKLIEESCP